MKTITVIGLLFISVVTNKAQSLDVMPLTHLEIKMSSSEVREIYPDAKAIFEKKDANGLPIEGVVFCGITNN